MVLVVDVVRQSPHAVLRLRGELGSPARDPEDVRVPRLRAQSLLATGHTSLVVDVAGACVADDGLELLAYVQRIYDLAGGTAVVEGLPLELELDLVRRALEWPESRARLRAEHEPMRAPGPLPGLAS